MNYFPEITKLKKKFSKHKIEFKPNSTYKYNMFMPVSFTVNGSSWNILVYDQYDDFNINNPLFCLFLLFRSLEDYKKSATFYDWCRMFSVDASDSGWHDYFHGLKEVYSEIENQLGEIKSHISDSDYQSRAQVIAELKKGL